MKYFTRHRPPVNEPKKIWFPLAAPSESPAYSIPRPCPNVARSPHLKTRQNRREHRTMHTIVHSPSLTPLFFPATRVHPAYLTDISKIRQPARAYLALISGTIPNRCSTTPRR